MKTFRSISAPRRSLACLAVLALILTSITALSASGARAVTPVHAAAPAALIDGDITADTTWVNTGVPYVVVAPIHVLATATLTVEAGVEVRFQPAAGLIVAGGLNAQGTQAQQVRMVADNGQSWQGLSVVQPSRDVTLQSVTISDANAGLTIQQPQGLTPAARTSRVDVLDSLFTANIIGVSADYSVTTGAPRLTMRSTLLYRNDTAMVLNGDPQGSIGLKLNHNSFVQNGIALRVLNVSGKGMKAQQQWWGSSDGPTIDATVCAGTTPAPGPGAPNLVCGNVDYRPWSKVAAGRMILPAGQAAVVESAVDLLALSDDTTQATGIVTLTVPLGTFNQTVDLLVAPRLPNDPKLKKPRPPGQPTDLALEVTAAANGQEIHTFAGQAPLVLTFTYTDQDLEGADPNQLVLFFFDPAIGAWSIGGYVSRPNPQNHRLTAYLSHLSRMHVSSFGLTNVALPLVQK